MNSSKTPKTPVKKPTDLPAKSSGAVKGGGIQSNDNVTLLRAAKPKVPKPNAAKKDLPARKGVKGGFKIV